MAEERTTDLLALWDAARRLGRDLSPADLTPDDPARQSRLAERIKDVRRFYEAIEGGAAPPSGSPAEPAGFPSVDGFEVIAEIGRGGMGVVYLARQEGLARLVALKMVRAGGHGTAGRFRDEARAIAALSHPHIVAAHAYGEAGGCPYLVFEFLAGGTLADRWAKAPQPPLEVARLVEKLAGAIRQAHERDVVHRDLKPENVLFSAEGVPKIADFGLARLLDGDSGLSFTGDVLGTPGYMAPEQAEGGPNRGEPAVDIFALGAILYEGLTGRPPFQGKSKLETLRLVRESDPSPPRRLRPGVPRDLERVCLKCLEKDPRRRYDSAGAVAADLRRFLNGEPVHARPAGPLGRARRLAARRPAAFVSAAVLAAAAAGLAANDARWRAEARRMEVRHLIDALGGAETARVPELVRRLRTRRDEARPLLREELRAPRDARRRFHAALALLPEDPTLVPLVTDRLLVGPPEEVSLARASLSDFGGSACPPLRDTLNDPKAPPGRKLRAACGLAGLDPDWPGWAASATALAPLLREENPLLGRRWAELLRPVGRHLLPALAEELVGGRAAPAGRRAGAGLYAALASGTPGGLDPLFAILEGPADAPTGPKGLEADRRRANAAALLIALGRGERAWPLFRHSEDPTARTALIEAVAETGVDPGAILGRLAAEPDVSARRALVLALGGLSLDQMPPDDKRRALDGLLAMYREDPDAGLHGALHWLFKHWGLSEAVRRFDGEIEGQPPGDRDWLVSRDGQVFSVITIPADASGPAGGRPYRLAVASNEVPNYRFQWFAGTTGAVAWSDPYREYSPRGCPALGVLWHEAAAYCNWLSRLEGIPEGQWCYVPGGGPGAAPLRLAADFMNRAGYRLPTVDEWVHASLGGARTPYAFGRDRDDSRHHGWFSENAKGRAHVVGSLKPNDFGLIDMYGNAFEYGEAPGSRPDHVLLGGSFLSPSVTINIVDRNHYSPEVRGISVGFRPVRKLGPDRGRRPGPATILTPGTPARRPHRPESPASRPAAVNSPPGREPRTAP